MKWVQRWENWLMTPFSTDRVSLGRPAICRAPGAILGRSSQKEKLVHQLLPASCFQLRLSSPYCIPVDVEGRRQLLGWLPTPPFPGSLCPHSIRPSPQSLQPHGLLACAHL